MGKVKQNPFVFGQIGERLKNMRDLPKRHGDVQKEKNPDIVYLGCTLDSHWLEEAMALKTPGKINCRLKFYIANRFFDTIPEAPSQ